MNKLNQEQHIMELDVTHDSGSEEWCCPACGRRLMIQWQPSFNYMVLSVGNEFIPHSGAKGGISVETAQMMEVEERKEDEPQLSKEEEERLGPWLDWMEKTRFDNLWEKDDRQ